MEVLSMRLDGPLLMRPRVLADDRGFFAETYRESALAEHGIHDVFVQDNHSRSQRGVVRGIHFQVGRGCSKLVRCGRGRIWDVVVDLRRGSPTFGEWEGVELADDDLRMVYVPNGFGHGFCVLSDWADVLYKQDAYYSAEVERGIAWDDPEVAIAWPLDAERITLSERDARAPRLSAVRDELPFVHSGAGTAR